MIRMRDVLTAAVACEGDEQRRHSLRRHAQPAWDDAQRNIGNAADLADVGRRHATLQRTMAHGALGAVGARGV
jgi:uncharacterized membrane protein